MLTLDAGLQLNAKNKVIGYADELALLRKNRSQVQEADRVLEVEALKVGLRISHDKTEFFHIKRYKDTWAILRSIRLRYYLQEVVLNTWGAHFKRTHFMSVWALLFIVMCITISATTARRRRRVAEHGRG